MKVMALLLGLWVVGCASRTATSTPVPFKMANDVIGNPCTASKYVVGLLINDPDVGLAIQDDQGVITRIVWRMTDSGRQLPNGEVEVLDSSGTVVATTGHKYRIGGKVATFFGDAFWACAGVFTPQ